MAHAQTQRYDLIWDDVWVPEALVGLEPASVGKRDAHSEPAWVRVSLIAVALSFLLLFLFVPLAAVFTEALRKGVT